MIEVKNLVKQYGSFLAVDHLDFTIERGSIYGFLGPNGAGKSTTMNMITGYLPPTSGTVLIDGFDICEEPEEARRRIGYLPEIPPVYLDMTPEEYLTFAAELKGAGRAGRKISGNGKSAGAGHKESARPAAPNRESFEIRGSAGAGHQESARPAAPNRESFEIRGSAGAGHKESARPADAHREPSGMPGTRAGAGSGREKCTRIFRRKMLRGEVERVMAAVGITHMRRRLIRNLSKGYRQRVGFACALLGDPEVIILDEPTVGLDPKQIMEIRDLIRSLGGQHTVILSSHILSEVSAVCDHILILSKGKLAARDTPENLTRRMQGTSFYDLLVEGEPETLKALLGQVEGLMTLEAGMDKSGFASVHLETAGDVDPRVEVFRILAKADCPIMELTSRSVSLEDVFMELTGTDGSADAGGRMKKPGKGGNSCVGGL